MYVIYCLQNESLKDIILSVGLTASLTTLKQMITDINKSYLPTPYTIFLTKYVSCQNSIEFVYKLLSKFGKHIHGTFFEIPPEIIKPIFELIPDEPYVLDSLDTDDHIVLQEKYRVVQGEIEYIIPKAIDSDYVDMSFHNVSSLITNLDTYYDHLSIHKHDYMDDIDL